MVVGKIADPAWAVEPCVFGLVDGQLALFPTLVHTIVGLVRMVVGQFTWQLYPAETVVSDENPKPTLPESVA